MIEKLAKSVSNVLAGLATVSVANNQVKIRVAADKWFEVASLLRDDVRLQFVQLIDLCGVDLLEYGSSTWSTQQSNSYSRGVSVNKRYQDIQAPANSRFLVVAQLLSITNNNRVMVHIEPVGDEPPKVPSVTEIWSSADWFEREAYDLFGIVFDNHPDLRRILTDYGFVGHPLRKDFPLVGKVELQFDEEHNRCIYKPVTTEMRTTVPRVIRPQIDETGE